MDYKVSVVVPIFNIFPYLEDCINSILEQTYDNIEIVLVDDGSTDDSGRLCEEYSEKYENIIVVHQVNAGLGMARNTGIRNAKGDYICFVDGDDYISIFIWKQIFIIVLLVVFFDDILFSIQYKN